MKINPKTLKIEIDLKEALEPDFEAKLQSFSNNVGEILSSIFNGIKSFKAEFETSKEYKEAFKKFCENKLNPKKIIK